jgi:hypothetical protein
MRVLNSGAGISVGTGSRVRNCDRGDKGYRGHNYPDRFKVWISGQVRRVTKAIRREMRRRATIEPVVGHLKDDIGCAVTISKAATETASTPFSPPLVTISPAPALVRGVFTRHVPDCSVALLAPTLRLNKTFFTVV